MRDTGAGYLSYPKGKGCTIAYQFLYSEILLGYPLSSGLGRQNTLMKGLEEEATGAL